MTITINTKTVTRSILIFSAGVLCSNKIKKIIKKTIRKKTNKIKTAANNKVEDIKKDINDKLHKAVDICFDNRGNIDIPVWKENSYETQTEENK